MSNTTFYFEWLGVDKNQFRILTLLAPKGEFVGNLSDMCRKLNLSVQTRNREKLKDDITALAEVGFITFTQQGRTYSIKAIRQETVIEIPAEWLDKIVNHQYSSETVSWQAVLKVLLWIIQNKIPIASEINCGIDTITSALNVLEREFNAIIREVISAQNSNGEIRHIGLELTPSAWWT